MDFVFSHQQLAAFRVTSPKEERNSVSHPVDAYHQPEKGNAVLLRLCNRNPAANTSETTDRFGSVIVAKPGQKVSGDTCSASWNDRTPIRLMVSDGLGSGPMAHEASKAAVDAFIKNSEASLLQQLGSMNEELKQTRGAAIAIAEIANNEISYCGIGNISGRIYESGFKSKSCMSYNGTVGYQMPDHKVLSYEWPENGLLIMSSDGLAPVWSLSNYPDLFSHDPTLIASVLYRDFGKGTDDIAIAVLKSTATLKTGKQL